MIRLALVMCACASTTAPAPEPPTTDGAIALANLAHQLARDADPALLLLHARLLSDDASLDRAIAIAQAPLDRARALAAAHEFAEAARALDDAPESRESRSLRAAIAVATGDAERVVAQLEADAAQRPDFASHGALAAAYVELARFAEADAQYAAALTALDTTLPFPYAWTYFARGVLWAEHAGDAARGEAMYRAALRYLPGFVAANLHLAELEAARGDPSATTHLQPALDADDPEAHALAAALALRTGDVRAAWRHLSRARERFETLVARHPRAYADHAAAFYLDAAPSRAWQLAQINLQNRHTRRACTLARTAARAVNERARCDP